MPYNVPNVGHVTGNAGHREFAMANGEMNHEQFREFNRAWMSVAIAHLGEGGLLATFIDWRSVEIVLDAGRNLGLALLNIVVWAKTNGGQGSLGRSQHELLPVFKKGEASHVNNIARPPRPLAFESVDLSRRLEPGIGLPRRARQATRR